MFDICSAELYLHWSSYSSCPKALNVPVDGTYAWRYISVRDENLINKSLTIRAVPFLSKKGTDLQNKMWGWGARFGKICGGGVSTADTGSFLMQATSMSLVFKITIACE